SLFSNETFYATRPVEQISYNLMRGSTAQGVDWPSTGTFVAPNSFVYKLRAATGFDRFDLPTDAQWEYACRAGTATVFNDGDPDATIASPHNITNPWLDSLGRYKYNGGYLNTGDAAIPPAGAGDWTTANGTARVGSYIPNAWGLYDMQGNVYEWVKDEHINPPPGGVDPVSDNPDGTNRIKRGGSWHRNAYQCSASERGADGASTVHYSFGMRVLLDLP
ncbi:MAG: formylglycine-generating enzyme family protein, partial [Lentisphaerae bacterium]|nr:formylglycine-generating enzyme family protein [Lentisphaerota bacterium]